MLKQIHAQVSDRRHDRWRVAFANAARILREDHIKTPVKSILYPPVSAHSVRETSGIGRDGGDKKTSFHRFGVTDPAPALDHADATQPLPLLGVWKCSQVLGDPVTASFQAPMILVHFLQEVMRCPPGKREARGG